MRLDFTVCFNPVYLFLVRQWFLSFIFMLITLLFRAVLFTMLVLDVHLSSCCLGYLVAFSRVERSEAQSLHFRFL